MEAETTKVIVISGVSRGLGRALALELAKLGHTIIGCSRDKIKLDSLQLQLSNASPRNHLLFNFDVKSNESIREMAQTVKEKFGSVDIIDTNMKGVANMLRHFIPLMLPKNKGIIVNVSSLYGRIAAARFQMGIEGLSKSVAKELPNGLTIVTLDPGIINTDASVTILGHFASQYQSPQLWALKAAPMILNITTADNGETLIVPDPGVLPHVY
ncbi:hypothetical protein CSA_004539 [Cucumis sativus]|uniref:Uncharacterized protein n=1 Tax=Cucumis sativus TaxID=3659 RepID=A0ACB6HBM2_CUCSA|nr:hypothetical protein CSA_004539 [Cucumis sativus]